MIDMPILLKSIGRDRYWDFKPWRLLLWKY